MLNMKKLTSGLIPVSIHREREAFMATAIYSLPIVDKDQAGDDIDLLRRRVRGKEEVLYVDHLASRAQDGNPITSAVAIGRIREELRTLAGGMSQMGRPHKPNGTKPNNA